MTAAGRQSAAAAVAALAAGVPIAPLTEDRSYLLLGAVLVLLSLAIGVGLRRAGAVESLVRLCQLAPVVLVPWLVPSARDPLRLYAETAAFVQTAFAPMPFDVGFALFSALLVWVAYLLTETLANGLASPAWSFPVLVLPYLIPTLAIYSETSPLLFAFPAAGYALVLATATRNAASGPAGTHEATAAGWRRGVLTTATLSTTLALAGAMLVSVPIPDRFGNSQSGGGPGGVQLGDPSLDLIRNITSPSERTVITYRTSDGAGEYLRLAALPAFDASGFHLVATDLVPLQFGGDLPRAAGPTNVRSTIQIGELASEYLPMPWFPVSVEAPGDSWRYDPRTLAVVAVGKGREGATRNQTYTTRTARLPAAERLLPTLEEAGDPGDGGLTLQLPPALPPSVRQLALDVTRRGGEDAAGAKALALADFLRSDAFTYSTAVAPGTTLGTLEDFLLGSRTGYCEQFAGALAVMARAVGIPSRVVVGFLPGRKEGDHWEVSSRNMHAWVELYFGDGVGWVPVDATPGGGVANPNSTASASASPSASVRPSTAPVTVQPSAPAPLPAGGGDDTGNTALAWVAGVLALLAVTAGVGPRLVRAALRRARLAPGRDAGRAAEGAWAEVRAAAVDRGRPWPAGTTREVAAQLGADLDEPGRAALAALAVTVERARYDRVVAPTPDLATQVSDATRAIERRWAVPTAGSWWPRSLRPRRLGR